MTTPNTESSEFCPTFLRPPVVETRIGLQFKPLSGIRAAHFGSFWRECLGEKEWGIGGDMALLPHEVERFDTTVLNPPPEDFGEVDSLALRSAFYSKDERCSVHFQPDRLVYSYSRKGEPRPSFAELRTKFDPLFERFIEFSRREGFGEVQPDLWEVVYTNAIPKGTLWQSPADWHKILPALFPPGGASVKNHEWATFEGEWFFAIPDQAGRIRVKVSKAVANQTKELVLLLVIRARGSLGVGKQSWSEGLNLGHQSANRAFYDLSSNDARLAWGYQS